jgi:tetratricopeptide (TPR) repeat protein
VGERFGLVTGLLWLDTEDMFDADLRGEWDKAVARADAFLERIAGSKHVQRGAAHLIRSCVFLARGDVEGALAEAELTLTHGREAQGEDLPPALAAAARVLATAGRQTEADALFAELLAEHRDELGTQWLRDLPLALVELGRGADYLAAVAETPPSPWLAAGIAVANGDFAEAAAMYERIGVRATEAWARLLAAESLAADGRWTEADEQLGRALDFFRPARATPFVRRSEALLGASAQAASGGMGPSASST